MKIMFIGGPNQRKDYHIEEGEEASNPGPVFTTFKLISVKVVTPVGNSLTAGFGYSVLCVNQIQFESKIDFAL